jgi:hypothetical protein
MVVPYSEPTSPVTPSSLRTHLMQQAIFLRALALYHLDRDTRVCTSYVQSLRHADNLIARDSHTQRERERERGKEGMAKDDYGRVAPALAPAPAHPTITLPLRPSMEAFFTGGAGASPGPMTLVSSFFSDGYGKRL